MWLNRKEAMNLLLADGRPDRRFVDAMDSYDKREKSVFEIFSLDTCLFYDAIVHYEKKCWRSHG